MLRTLVLMAAAGGVLGTNHVAWGQRAPVGFYRMGVPEGYRYTSATVISGDGVSVAGDAVANNFRSSVLEWTHASGTSYVVPPASTFYWEATGISRDGGVRAGTANLSGRDQPVRWTPGSQPVALGVPGQWARAWCEGMSGDGSTIVGRAYSTSGSAEFGEPLRWTAATGVQGMGIVPGSAHGSAFAATYDGSLIVGGANDSQGEGRGFLWRQDTGYQLIAEAYRIEAVSANGTWIGGVLQDSSPFRMDAGGTIVDLDPTGLLRSGVTTGISQDGRVVIGRAQLLGSIQTSFVWTEARGLQLIDAFLASEGVPVPAGFVFTSTHLDVSEDGLVFAGTALNEAGRAEGWVAVIPAPASGGAFALWLLIAGRRRR